MTMYGPGHGCVPEPPDSARPSNLAETGCLHNRTQPMYAGPKCIGRRCKICHELLLVEHGRTIAIEWIEELEGVLTQIKDREFMEPSEYIAIYGEPSMTPGELAATWLEVEGIV